VEHTRGERRGDATATASPASAPPLPAAPARWRRREGWVGWLAPVIFCLLRAPSLIEPHWYTDEAGYAVTAWLAIHGHPLYGAVWNNKPPLLFWTYGLLVAWFGPSEAALHAASLISGLIAVGVVHRILLRHQGAARAAIGGLIAAVLLGTPVLNGDLALPENLLIGPAAVGILLLLRAEDASPGRRTLGWTAAAGGCFAVATLYQQTALDVVGAATLWLLVRSGWSGRHRLAALLGPWAALVVAALAPYAIWVGPSRLVFLLVTSYTGYTASSLPPTLTNLAVRLIEVGALLAGAWLARRLPSWQLLVWIWAACALIVATLPNRPYPHFGLPAVAPVAILLASARWPRADAWRRLASPPRVGEALLLLAALVPVGIGWSLLSPPGAFYSLELTGVYYQSVLGRLDGTLGRSAFRSPFGQEATAEVAVASWLRSHHLAGSSAVVWSANAWVDLLTPLRPDLVTPTVYMNEYWLGAAGVLARIRRARPRVIVADQTSLEEFPGVVPILHAAYREVEVAVPMSVWLRRS